VKPLGTRIALLTATLALGAAGPALGYRVEGKPWPSGLVPYYNAAPGQAWAVAQAVNAWNTSGARVRFVPVPRASARLVIVDSGSAGCERAEATVGYGPRTVVRIWNARAVPSSCTSAMAATALAHELGHVLGLVHESRGCAAMNPTFSDRGPGLCTPVERWEWRCRLLEYDDVAGAIALYGGTVRTPRAPACPLYRAIAAPAFVSATQSPGLLTVRLGRPASPLLPRYLPPRTAEAFAPIWRRDACATTIDPRTPRYRWPAGSPVELRERTPSSPGSYCLAIWAFDSLGRPSDTPVRISVRVP
jgi:hypothetical protein